MTACALASSAGARGVAPCPYCTDNNASSPSSIFLGRPQLKACWRKCLLCLCGSPNVIAILSDVTLPAIAWATQFLPLHVTLALSLKQERSDAEARI